MADIRALKLFSATVTLAPITPTSMGALMRDSILHWWTNDDGSPSMDASIGSGAGVVSSGTLWIGSDENVFDTNADPKYQGVEIAANVNYSLQDFCRGVIDPWTIWFYAPGTRTLKLVFNGA